MSYRMHSTDRADAARRLWGRAFNRIAGVVVRVRTSDPVLALTFDDGPNPAATPALLEILAAHGARATFFQTGNNAAAHPELVAAVHRAGHSIGNHTWDHPSLPLVSRAERRRQVRDAAKVLPRAGKPLFRPPYGHLDSPSHLDLWLCGQELVAWSVAVPDWEERAAAELAEIALEGARPGEILLMHDGLADFLSEGVLDRRPTLEAVEILLETLNGSMEFVTVPELMRRGKPVRECWRMAPDIGMLNQLRREGGDARRYNPAVAPPGSTTCSAK